MRLSPLLVAVILGAAPAAALAGDRYGNGDYAPEPRPSLMSRALGWAHKSDTPQDDQAPVVYAQPEPLALAGQFLRGRSPTPGAAALRPSPSDRSQVAYAPVYPAFTPQEPYRPAAARPAVAPPEAPTAPPPETPSGSPALAGGLPPYVPPAQAAVSTPQRLAEAAPTTHSGGEQARLYSVHRPYGLTPDAIAEPAQGQQGYVLIGPSGGGVAQAPAEDAAGTVARDDADGDGGDKRERPF
ncbi:hypothetical protein [Phenylobacterium aquaticum]|uniref:hypothetical protein n=1 Tax=Phenylobacterium aquaticum TaxID=1763816 RepID=UPI001F5C60A0|nr:hypothetical protein [Phenylobacterium aquaticum]MCI3133731.1 hypothetical protein [Phenylobacterium aquaticum]